jgi:hypothetical protein
MVVTSISKLARNQSNDLKALGDDECSKDVNFEFLTVEIYKIY